MSPKRKRPAQAGTGSPQAGEPDYLAVGFLRRPHGVHGEILMTVYTDFPERLQPGVQLYVGEARQAMTLKSVRGHHRGLLVRFEEAANVEEAGRLRNTWVFVRTADRPPLPEGEYYFHQLLGLMVCLPDGRVLGTVSEILETGANEVLIVHNEEGAEFLIPFIDAVVQTVDLPQRRLHITPLPGLLPE